MRVYAIAGNPRNGEGGRREEEVEFVNSGERTAPGMQERGGERPRIMAFYRLVEGKGGVGEGTAGTADRKHVGSGIHMQPREY